ERGIIRRMRWLAIVQLVAFLLLPGFSRAAVKLVWLDSFKTNAWYPDCSLTPGKNGDLYGTSSAGFGQYAFGTVFKITPDGHETVLCHSFDGDDPIGNVIVSPNGSVYGTTDRGGVYGSGTIFKLQPNGKLITVYSFDGTNGGGPCGL